MLPYFSLVSFKLGPLNIYIWGLCVSVGFLAGILTAYFVSKKWNLDFNKIFNLSVLLLISGLLGARFFWWLENINEINSIWQFLNIKNGGLSSLGGFVFAGVVLAVWFVQLREPRFDTASGARGAPEAEQLLPKPNKEIFWKYLDILAIGFMPLWIFSRLGCFLIHDHPGRLSNFFLAVKFPAGALSAPNATLSVGARFDMALLEIILMILIGVLFLIVQLSKRRNVIPAKAGIQDGPFMDCPVKPGNDRVVTGTYALLLVLIYSFTRFFLDFLRAVDLPISDPRYFGLTLAQYGMALLFILTVAMSRIFRQRIEEVRA